MTEPNRPELSIEDKIQQVNDFIETARSLIYYGDGIDITELDLKVSELCKDIEKLPPRKANSALEQLQILFKKIDVLEKDLALQHDLVTQRLQLKQNHANPLMAQEVDDDEN